MTLLFPLPLGPTTAEKLCTVGNKFNFLNTQLQLIPDITQLLKNVQKTNPNLMERANALFACIRFEVSHNHFFNE